MRNFAVLGADTFAAASFTFSTRRYVAGGKRRFRIRPAKRNEFGPATPWWAKPPGTATYRVQRLRFRLLRDGFLQERRTLRPVVARWTVKAAVPGSESA